MDDYPDRHTSYTWQKSAKLWRTSHEETPRQNIILNGTAGSNEVS
jgi:hypothetical protein